MTVGIGDLTEDDVHSSLEPAEVEYVAIKMLQKNKVLNKQVYRLNKRNEEDQRELKKVIKAYDKLVEDYNALLKENEKINIALKDLDSCVTQREMYYKKLDKKIEESNFITPVDEAMALASVAEEMEDQIIDVESTEPILTAKLCINDTKEAKSGSSRNGAHHKGGRIGVKSGKSSKYRYMSYDKKNDIYIAETEDRGKKLKMGRDKDPVALALKVDAFLDKFEANDPTAKKRPRNRNFHPEVMEAFIVKAEGKKIVAKVTEDSK